MIYDEATGRRFFTLDLVYLLDTIRHIAISLRIETLHHASKSCSLFSLLAISASGLYISEASASHSDSVSMFPKTSLILIRIIPEPLRTKYWNASNSPCISLKKNSVALGRARIALRLMISVLTAFLLGYFSARSLRYWISGILLSLLSVNNL